MEDQSLQNIKAWSRTQKAAFRFFSIYFLLYLFTSPFDGLYIGMVTWLSRTVGLGGSITVLPNGSGDTTFNYLQLICLLAIALIASLIWWLLDHKRKHYDPLLYWFLVLLRYGLAYYMIVYGFAKIFPDGQFPSPSLIRYMQTYGESSPMGLAWTFMGHSREFTLFTGMAEALAGFLLFFRRTTMFGCLFGMIVLANIVALNFCYDIPVKIFSSHLFLIAFFILSPDLPRLIGFFFQNKLINPVRHYPAMTRGWERITWIVLKVLILGLITFQQISGYSYDDPDYVSDVKKLPLYGIYDVRQFISAGDTLAPLTTDTSRWYYLVLDRNQRAFIRRMDGIAKKCEYAVDTSDQTLTLRKEDKPLLVFAYQKKDSNHLLLHSYSKALSIDLQKRPDTFLLKNRGFRWINEYPFNK
jgi:uncharacterized membrane protein YphA (DoxX/SURF4 family)